MTMKDDLSLKERNEAIPCSNSTDLSKRQPASYTKALALLDENTDTSDARRRAVLYSNRSSCHFEQRGQYSDSIVDAKLCLARLLKGDNATLRYKNV
jgi:hypothetical protein